jgi:pimeloyl-ACP methyl ester carboxylesterase
MGMKKGISFSKISQLLLAAMVVTALLPAIPAHAASAADGNCQSVRLPVALSPGQAANQTVSGNLCTPLTWASGTHQVDVLTPGGTYNSLYWDWPQDPTLYSYADKTLQAGRATFTYDRLGTGASSHPLSALLTINTEAYVLHQAVTWVHSQGFGQANLFGHSYGSMITAEEAGTYNDASRVVITGMTHIPAIGVGLIGVVGSLYPAALDSEFQGKGLDLGYLTTEPNTRAQAFYSSSADPSVIAYDEAHKDVAPVSGVATIATTYAIPAPLNASDKITAPVLLMDGQEDAAFCLLPNALYCASGSALRTSELPYYAAAASVTGEVVPGTGHDLTLHPSANESFNMINQWVKTH